MTKQNIQIEKNNSNALQRSSFELARKDYLKESMSSQREQLAGVLFVAEESKRKLLQLLESMEGVDVSLNNKTKIAGMIATLEDEITSIRQANISYVNRAAREFELAPNTTKNISPFSKENESLVVTSKVTVGKALAILRDIQRKSLVVTSEKFGNVLGLVTVNNLLSYAMNKRLANIDLVRIPDGNVTGAKALGFMKNAHVDCFPFLDKDGKIAVVRYEQLVTEIEKNATLSQAKLSTDILRGNIEV